MHQCIVYYWIVSFFKCLLSLVPVRHPTSVNLPCLVKLYYPVLPVALLQAVPASEYIPDPFVTGLTTGIAVVAVLASLAISIISSQ